MTSDDEGGCREKEEEMQAGAGKGDRREVGRVDGDGRMVCWIDETDGRKRRRNCRSG